MNDSIINKYLNENKKSIADEIEDMDANVSSKDRNKFDSVLNKALKKIDPKNDLSIADAVMKMSDREAKKLLNDLLEFTYDN